MIHVFRKKSQRACFLSRLSRGTFYFMPSQIAHSLAGEAALTLAAPDTAGKILSGALAPYFRLGCQGPDLFYHSQRTRPLALHYGVLAHRRGFGRIVEGLAETWTREDGDPFSAWAAFILGFATHGALDRAAHPYIVYCSGWTEPGKPETNRFRGCHAFLERILDVLVWERLAGTPVSAFDARAKICPTADFPRFFPERLAAAFRYAYRDETERDAHLTARMANALEDSRRFLVATNPYETSRSRGRSDALHHLQGPHGLRIISVIYPEVFDRGVDWAGERGGPWIHPCQGGAGRRESFFDLFKAARNKAAVLLKTILDGFHSRSVPHGLAAAAGNGTLNVGDGEGRPAKPHFHSPLPLPEAMAAELRARLDPGRGL